MLFVLEWILALALVFIYSLFVFIILLGLYFSFKDNRLGYTRIGCGCIKWYGARQGFRMERDFSNLENCKECREKFMKLADIKVKDI